MGSYPRNILLVEDDEADALLIQDALEQRSDDRAITQVGDGIAALEHLRTLGTAHPDLIVLDLNMPRMNGHELLEVLKSDRALRRIPVVILTTSSSSGDVETAYTNHANAYVVKPLTLKEYTEAVHSIDDFFLETVTIAGALT